ncbi:hypothetical protein ACLOJK_027614 [Asimina triloba]
MEMDMEKVVCGNGDFVSWERVLGSLVEAAVAEALLDAAGKSVVCLLLAFLAAVLGSTFVDGFGLKSMPSFLRLLGFHLLVVTYGKKKGENVVVEAEDAAQ